jgi:probable phosphoglycerate mutase
MTTNLYIIRHGEAVCNVEGIVGGIEGCQGLTERGHAQAQKLGQRLASGEIAADVLFASTFRRARETAKAVSEGLRLPIQWDDEFQEVRPGDADTLTYAEVRERFKVDTADRVYTPWAPNSESWAAFNARVGLALTRVTDAHAGKTIVVVAHGGIVEASFFYFMGLPLRSGAHVGFGTRHTSITHWRLDPEAKSERWLLMRFNDAAHLDAQLTPTAEAQ